MKKIKFGFTVAEMITAMSIVGIISAFVIPLSIKSFNKHQAGIVLGSAVEQIILGNQNIIQLVNVNAEDSGSYTDSLVDITQNDLLKNSNNANILDTLNEVVCPFWRLNTELVTIDSVKDFEGTVIENSEITADNNTFRYNFAKIPAAIAMSRSSGDWNIYIDTNGFRSNPNTYGKDIFAFRLQNDGTLRPFDAILDGEENGLHFTERVVREGFRVTYY